MSKVKSLTSKDLLGLKDLSAEDLRLVFQTAESLKEVFHRPIKRVPALNGKTIFNLFYEPSTRTKSSFEMAAKMLSATTGSITTKTSSMTKGETLIDTAKNIEVMGIDAIVIRHSMAGAPQLIAKNLKASVINAGDGFNEHPTQGLLDIFTMQEKKKTVKGKTILIVGDIAHSRVARSNIWGLKKLGARVIVCGPPTLIPVGIEEMGAEVSCHLDKVIGEADFINVLRIQMERQGKGLFPSREEYTKLYGIDAARMKKAKKDVVIMHPGPINRGLELSTEVADGPYNVILDQVKNGVAIRMAVLFLLLGGKNGN
ncbi:MAG: aspartate carbamoyltransferase catalytic subunit [Candidatus Margulisbacteria bacterium]|nr:aspartate carbamoyltransferase catalytic subunit [Candidatus Margulisiibacteriota bacterium]MBU1022459.1 aspartate carbamoyltransferase catalytic subunit [Candidatus Margulisiibacteriota bacterium]MBU1728443.1 aspartate carbamoyltransferase catalytic subunit [Candidatus Margulisiibacteriota bacterium]MBU1954590.1 aspartate carbamoyltransferase catalytic subunit [Candidatus Margulisiibacteriota bacterium]